MSTRRAPGDPTRQKACLDLIRTGRVMTLGTASLPEHTPWTAPVYYLFRNRRFYFFSNPNARHIREGENRTCSAAVFKDAPAFEALRGIQMAGRIVPCPPSLAAAKIAFAYAAQFGICPDPSNILSYFSDVFHANLFAFEPETVFFMDNRMGFGRREPIAL